MKRKYPLILSLAALICLGACNDGRYGGQQPGGTYYDKDVPYFGIPRQVKKYTVAETINNNETTKLKWHGRYLYDSKNNATWFSFSNAGFEVTFTGTTLEGYFLTTGANAAKSRPFLAVAIDNDYDPDKATPIQLCDYGDYDNAATTSGGFAHHKKIVLAHGLENTKHTVRIYKRSEALFSRVGLRSLSTDGSFSNVEAKQLDYKIEVFGDSVTCGYAVESDDFYENFSTRTENSMKSYANYAANKINADVSLISCGGYPLYKSIYSDGCKPNTIPDMFNKLEVEWTTNNTYVWDNASNKPDVVIIALGANDGTYVDKYKDDVTSQNQFLKEFNNAYVSFLNKIKTAYGNIPIVISDEVIPVNSKIVNEINKVYNDNKDYFNLYRATYTSYQDAKNRTMPGSGHPNQEMQQIAGNQLGTLLETIIKK